MGATELTAQSVAPNNNSNARQIQTQQLQEFYARIELQLRRKLQENLVWTGYYPGPIDGEIGEGTFTAIRKFQKDLSGDETGLLLQPQFSELTKRANAQIQTARFVVIVDQATGIKIGLPSALLPERKLVEGGTDYFATDRNIFVALRNVRSDTNLRNLYERLRAELTSTTIDYDAFRGEWFVISGIAENKRFYVRYHFKQEEIAGFFLIYGTDIASRYPPAFFSMMSFSMQPFEVRPEGALNSPSASSLLLQPAALLRKNSVSQSGGSRSAVQSTGAQIQQQTLSSNAQGQVAPPSAPKADASAATSGNSVPPLLVGILILLGCIFLMSMYQRHQRWKQLVSKYGEADASLIWQKQIWQGMTREQLVDSWGKPVDIDQNLYKTKKKETWKYGQTGKNRFNNRVILENDFIVGWDSK